MTFRQFLVNYLSPFYFLARVFWIAIAAQVWIFGKIILMAFGMGESLAVLAGAGLTASLVWNALRPWKIGPSYNDLKQRLDEFGDRYK